MGHASYIRQPDGSRYAVLMIHGICGTPRHFDCLLPYIPADWAVYNILLDGHGGDPQDFSHSSMKKWKAQAQHRLSELCKQYDTVIVMGHSMGTLLLLQEAAQYPQVKGMILLNSPLKPWVRAGMVVRLLRITFGCIDEANVWHTATRSASGVAFTKRIWLYLGFIPRYLELLKLCKQSQPLVSSIAIPCYACHSRFDELVSARSVPFFQDHPMIHHDMLEHSGHFYYAPEDLELIAAGIETLFNRISERKEPSYER